MRKQNMKKGSFTVEAACVMSLVLLVILAMIYLFFFVHNRAWLTAAACESALAGSMEGTKEDGKVYETADMRAKELANVRFFGAENLSKSVKAGKEVQVAYSAETISGGGSLHWNFMVQGKSKIIRPVEWIRKIKAAKELIE